MTRPPGSPHRPTQYGHTPGFAGGVSAPEGGEFMRFRALTTALFGLATLLLGSGLVQEVLSGSKPNW